MSRLRDGERSDGAAPVFGVVLAGGASSRFPGGKARAVLAGDPLLNRAVGAMRAAGLEPVVVARPETSLPVTGARVLREPDREGAPHPLLGIAHAMRELGGPAVYAAVDLPLVPPSLLVALAGRADPGCVVAVSGAPAALLFSAPASLARALEDAAGRDAPALRTLVAAGVEPVDLAVLCPGLSPDVALANVNAPADLEALAVRLAG